MSPSSAPSIAAKTRPPLRGRLRPIGDGSVSLRALILGLLTIGETTIEGLLESENALRAGQACRALGARVERLGPGRWRIAGAGVGTLLRPRDTLDLGDARAAARLMFGVIAGHSITAVIDGGEALRNIPMQPVLEPLTLMGAEVLSSGERRGLPLTLRGTGDPAPLEYRMPLASPQLKSAILLCGLNSPGQTTVIEATASRDHMERLLTHFGADVAVRAEASGGRRIILQGRPRLEPRALAIPADPSMAAFLLVAAAITPGSDVIVEGVMTNPLRYDVIDTLLDMGADIQALAQLSAGGEETVDLRVRSHPLRGVDAVGLQRADMPALAVAAAFAEGETILRGAASFAGQGLEAALQAAGVDCGCEGVDFLIRGRGRPAGGGALPLQSDPRIAMGMAVLGLAAKQPVRIDDRVSSMGVVAGLFADLAALGADFG